MEFLNILSRVIRRKEAEPSAGGGDKQINALRPTRTKSVRLTYLCFMKMETKDFNSSSSKKSQTSDPVATLRNQIVDETRILEASIDLCSPTEKSVEHSGKPTPDGYGAIKQKG